MNIVYVSTGTRLAGAEVQVLSLARGMRRRGHGVHILSLAPLGDVGRLAQEEGLSVTSLNIPGKRALPRAVGGLTRVWQATRPDVVHSHLVHANLVSRLARLLRPVPVLISTGHSVREGGAWSTWAYRATDPLCDLTTNVSREAVARYRETGAVARGKLRFVPNGLDLAAFDRAAGAPVPDELAPPGGFAWIAVGRLEPAKDHPTLLAAFARVAAAHPGARLNIVGEGRLQGEARDLAQRLGLGEQVRFLGARADVPALLTRADALVLSSAWEGLPMVLLEAGAARRPVVTTRVGGTADAVRDGRTGLLVPPRDPAALAEAMRRVMALPGAERRRMGELGREHVAAHFALDRVVDEWEAIYRELLADERGAA